MECKYSNPDFFTDILSNESRVYRKTGNFFNISLQKMTEYFRRQGYFHSPGCNAAIDFYDVVILAVTPEIRLREKGVGAFLCLIYSTPSPSNRGYSRLFSPYSFLK